MSIAKITRWYMTSDHVTVPPVHHDSMTNCQTPCVSYTRTSIRKKRVVCELSGYIAPRSADCEIFVFSYYVRFSFTACATSKYMMIKRYFFIPAVKRAIYGLRKI